MAIRIDPALPLAGEVSRISDQLSATIVGHLDGSGPFSFHEARKANKKLRALLRLTRKASPEAMRRIDTHLRDAGRALAGPREADAAIEMLERFIQDYPERIVDCQLGEMRALLLRQRSGISDDAIEASRLAALAYCAAARAELAAMAFDSGRNDDAILAHGMEKTLHHWRKRLEQAKREKEPGEAFHDLRKAVKAHAAQLTLMRDFAPQAFDARRPEVDDLGERLGEINDIVDMRVRLKAGRGGDIDARSFDRLMKAHAAKLARKAARKAEALLDNAPDDLRRRIRRATAVKDAA